jgi:hypothetical protein
MPITHDESTRTIIVTGDNNGVPYTYEDIYQYTTSQGLDWITKFHQTQEYINKLVGYVLMVLNFQTIPLY